MDESNMAHLPNDTKPSKGFRDRSRRKRTVNPASFMSGLVVASFALVACGAVAFAMAIPAFSQGEGDNQSPLSLAGLFGASERSANANGLPSVIYVPQGSDNMLGAGNTSASLALLNSSALANMKAFQSLGSELEKVQDNMSSITDGSIADSGNSGSQGNSGSSAQKPSADVPAPPSEAEENQYHQALVTHYNWAAGHYNTLLSGYNQLISELNSGHNRPGGSFHGTLGVNAMALQTIAMRTDISPIPSNSRWYQSGQHLMAMYSDLGNADAFLSRIKGFNPITVENELSSRLTPDGRVAYLVDFEQRAAQLGL